MAARLRSKHGRFKKKKKNQERIFLEHNYVVGETCEGADCTKNECSLCDTSDDEWKRGRRVIELSVLLENLRYCGKCGLGPVPLTLFSVRSETKKGLGGYYHVQCQNHECGFVNTVAYGKTHRSSKTGSPCFVVNTKLGTAMIDSLGGPTRVNNVLMALNIPSITNRNLKKMERRAGTQVEKVAHHLQQAAAKDTLAQEMEDIIQQEMLEAESSLDMLDPDLGVALLPDSSPSVKATVQSVKETGDGDISWTQDDSEQPSQNLFQSPSSNGHRIRRRKFRQLQKQTPSAKRKLVPKFPAKSRYGISCAVDTAWHKRGFDSLTSHTFFMSKARYGKKVIKSIISHRTCGTCNWWRRNRPGQPVREHRCVRTHRGSARSMEASSGELGVKQLMDEGIPIEIMEGDGDSTLLARLKSNLNLDMKKKYDKNHIVKNITKSLYTLSNEKDSKLSKTVVAHIQKCLKYIFAKNQGNPEGMKGNLSALVPHQFGDHSICEPVFCGFKRQPGVKYLHKSLPYKTALKDTALRSKLEKLFEPVIANASTYSDLGSSQQCEHANREVTLRAPKSLHYGNSESLDFRVQATAAFINEGRNYITQLITCYKNMKEKVNEAGGLSPGVFTVKHAAKCMESRRKAQERSELPSTKRRRNILKQERSTNQCANEALEGHTYQSGIGLLTDVDTENLPEAVPKGNLKPVHVTSGEPTHVMFDLETTDLIRGSQMPHITQISAFEPKSGQHCNIYVLPKVPVAAAAQQITGVVVDGPNMTVFGKSVQAVHISSAFTQLFGFLSNFSNVILVAHNGKRFDFPVIINSAINSGNLEQFLHCTIGMVDSLTLFKEEFPGQSSYRQEDLVRNILNITYGAHDALEDVKALGKLILMCNSAKVMASSFPSRSFYHHVLHNKAKAENLPTLHILVANGVCKAATAENIAGSGLQLRHLRAIYSRKGEDGLRNTFTMTNEEGQPRVTNNKRVLESVIPKLVEYFQK